MILRPWPDELDGHLLAKSASQGADGQPESLAQHTALVLTRLAEFIHLRPQLPHQLGQPHLWHTLYWATFLHDFGKAMPGFQAILRPDSDPTLKEQWRGQRHELFSLPFLDWISEGLTTTERRNAAAAIISHHRDAPTIQSLYPVATLDSLQPHFAALSATTLHGLHRWLSQAAWPWAQQLGLTELGVRPVQIIAHVPPNFATTALQSIAHWLDEYEDLYDALQWEREAEILVPYLALRGTLMNADHTASAHTPPLPSLSINEATVLQSRRISPEKLYKHQADAARANGSALLTAPTGSGKTEAALLWAAGQLAADYPGARLFYTLPYQASMNAMEGRLKQTFDWGREVLVQADPTKTLVGLQHGRALLALYQQMMDKQEGHLDKRTAHKQARWLKNLNQLNYPPVRVFSPYQMLKAMYRLKGYEAQLTDYHNALFIFDEIHAYEVKRLALILKTIEYLRRHYNARFFIMSATFPTLIKTWLTEALGQLTEVTATPQLFQEFQRHRLHLLSGELNQNLHLITADARAHKSVLVVCNTVNNAQDVHQQLQQQLADTDIEPLLLHGRFNMRDRATKESDIMAYTGAHSPRRRPTLLVATQVVEVSLDIDFDTIYTEPAPLEALVQRFGRVNRARKQAIVPVHIFDQPQDGQGIYDERLIQGTISILARENGQPLDEHQVGRWLDEIYSDTVAHDWHTTFMETATEFEQAIIHTLHPFHADRMLQQQFGKMFDGVDILPADLHNDYYDLIENHEYLEAQRLLVSISWRQFHIQRSKGLIHKDPDLDIDIAHLPYTSTNGLDLTARE